MEISGSPEIQAAGTSSGVEPGISIETKRRKKLERVYPSAVVPDVMDIKELASYLGLGKSKIYALISTKKIPASKIGRQYRFSKSLVDRWLQEQVITQEKDLSLFEQGSKLETK